MSERLDAVEIAWRAWREANPWLSTKSGHGDPATIDERGLFRAGWGAREDYEAGATNTTQLNVPADLLADLERHEADRKRDAT